MTQPCNGCVLNISQRQDQHRAAGGVCVRCSSESPLEYVACSWSTGKKKMFKCSRTAFRAESISEVPSVRTVKNRSYELQQHMSFDKLMKLRGELGTNLSKLGFHYPTAIQTLAIPVIYGAPRAVILSAPTGTGKTLCYSLPIASWLLDQVLSRYFRFFCCCC